MTCDVKIRNYNLHKIEELAAVKISQNFHVVYINIKL